jgi:hypothetical protein
MVAALPMLCTVLIPIPTWQGDNPELREGRAGRKTKPDGWRSSVQGLDNDGVALRIPVLPVYLLYTSHSSGHEY